MSWLARDSLMALIMIMDFSYDGQAPVQVNNSVLQKVLLNQKPCQPVKIQCNNRPGW